MLNINEFYKFHEFTYCISPGWPSRDFFSPSNLDTEERKWTIVLGRSGFQSYKCFIDSIVLVKQFQFFALPSYAFSLCEPRTSRTLERSITPSQGDFQFVLPGAFIASLQFQKPVFSNLSLSLSCPYCISVFSSHQFPMAILIFHLPLIYHLSICLFSI